MNSPPNTRPTSAAHRPFSMPLVTLAGLVVLQGVFFASSFRVWSLVAPTLSVAIVVVFVLDRFAPRWLYAPKAFRADSFQSVLTIIAGLTLITWLTAVFRFSALLRNESGAVLAGFDSAAHIFFFGSLFLWCLYPKRGHVLMLFFGLAVVMLGMSVGGVSRSLQAQTAVGIVCCIGFVLASRIVIPARSQKSIRTGVRRVQRRLRSPVDQHRGFSTQRYQALLAVTVLLMMVTGATANVTNRYLPNIQDLLLTHLDDAITSQQINSNLGGFRYVDGSNLGNIRSVLLSDETGIALRVLSDDKPGYLRGNVFDYYENRSWSSLAKRATNDERRLYKLQNRRIESLAANDSRFALNDAASDAPSSPSMEIKGESFRGAQVFIPLKSGWIESTGSAIEVDHHGVVVSGVDNSQRYKVAITPGIIQEELEETRREICLSIDNRIRRSIEQVANQVFIGNTNAKQKANAVSNFFQENFAYSLDLPRSPRGVDPLIHFLETRHDAHCEYFASATSLLLRAAGVPTRYVTGYVVDAGDSLSDSFNWVARNKDAHAWVEAYDDETRQWFPVESTPGRDYFSVEEDSEQNQNDALGGGAQNQDVQDRALGWIQGTIGAMLAFRTTDTIYSLFRYLQIIALIAMVGWLVRRYRQRAGDLADPDERRSLRMLAKVDRQMKRLGYVRSTGESLYRFADRIESEAALDTNLTHVDPIIKAAAWFRQYADARYQGGHAPAWDA